MVDLQYCGRCTCVTQRNEPDGSEGTVTVKWSNGEETVGCMVKNDNTFRKLTGNTVTEETEYYAYTRILSENSNKADISVHRFTKPRNKKECTVDDVVNKKVCSKSNHEYMFVPCEHPKFNRSSFLKKYSLNVESPTLSPREVCEHGKVMGLCKEGNPERLLKIFDFEINKESNSDRFYIEDDIFDKLEETGPLLIGRGDKTLSVVGYYRKQPTNHINIFTFGTDTETVDVFRQSHGTPPPPVNENPPPHNVPGPPLGNDVDELDSNPSLLKLSDLFDRNRSALDDLGLYLDLKYRVLQNWRNLADLLNAPTDIKDRCESNKKHSPTELLFDIPKVSSVPLKQLLQLLKDIPRNDVRDKITEKISDSRWNEKVSETLMNDYDLFDEVAVALDKDSRLKNNWEKLGQKLGVRRDDLNQIKRGNNSANELLLYAYRTLEPEKLEAGWFYSKINESFPCRKDIKDLMDGLGITQEDNRSLKNVFEPESENIRKLCALLNRNAGGTLKDWRNLAIEWGIEKKIYDQFDNQEKLSPTKILLEDWLLNEKPNFTVGELCEHLRTMKRNDARDLLKEKVNEHMRKISGTGR